MMCKKKSKTPDFSEKYIRWFSQLNNKDVALAGGKGASLSEMYNNKFPVPPGFIITSKAFDLLMTEYDLKDKIKDIISALDYEDTESLQKASADIRAMVEEKDLPKELESEIIEAYHILSSYELDNQGISQSALNILRNAQEPIFVSVRSSATTEDLVDASFAGQQESFLNIKGSEDLLEYVKKCFSSLYTARAMYYRNKKGFKEEESLLAVVIQKMVDSEKSGIIFSKDPINMNDDIVMESVFGLGEGIVSGKIHPDNHIVSRDLKIKKTKVSDKKIAIVRTSSGDNETVKLSSTKSNEQVLTDGEVLELANIAIRLEDHYKKPQDIEFAIENNEVYIVQSRPITTLEQSKQAVEELSGTPILEGLNASPGIGVGIVKIIEKVSDLAQIKKGEVLVTKMTNPDMVVAMQKSSAIVTDEGGMTSHASIVSREMGIPAVVGTRKATSVLKDGMKITVDGNFGKVYEGEIVKAMSAEIKPAVKTKKIKLKVIVDLPEFAERAAKSEIDFIGLTRIEGMITKSGKHPLLFEKEDKLDEYTENLRKGIEDIVEHFRGIWIRASDIRTDEFSSLKGAPEKEINPMLGLHGIRFSLKHPEILKAELLAIKHVAQKHSSKEFGIMFPQIISIEEVEKAKQYFDEIKIHNMRFGVMIETPASVQIIDDICPLVDFISFGTNDLTQFTLAVDRGEDRVQHLYNELHPAIFSQIGKVIDACRKSKTESSICGQAGSNPEMVKFLFKKGIDSISVNADAGAKISELIRELEAGHIEEEPSEEERIKERQKEIEKEDKETMVRPAKEVEGFMKREQEAKEVVKTPEVEISEEGKIPDEQWKRLTRKERKKLLRKIKRKRKREKRIETEDETKQLSDKNNPFEKRLDPKNEGQESSLSFESDSSSESLIDTNKNKSHLPKLPKPKDTDLVDSEDVEKLGEKYEPLLDKENIQIPAEVEYIKKSEPISQEIESEPELPEPAEKSRPIETPESVEPIKEPEREKPRPPEPDMQEHIGAVKPFGSLERIEDKIEDVQQDAQEEKLEEIKEDREIEQNIQTSFGEEVIEKPVAPVSVPSDTLNGTREGKEDEGDIEEGISSEPSNPGDIGVYNPNEEQDNKPQAMEYRFDDDEDIYSDVF